MNIALFLFFFPLFFCHQTVCLASSFLACEFALTFKALKYILPFNLCVCYTFLGSYFISCIGNVLSKLQKSSNQFSSFAFLFLAVILPPGLLTCIISPHSSFQTVLFHPYSSEPCIFICTQITTFSIYISLIVQLHTKGVSMAGTFQKKTFLQKEAMQDLP